MRGRVDDTTPGTSYYSLNGEAGNTLVIELRGDQRSFDLDMLVSGPGYALQAQGGLSNSDTPRMNRLHSTAGKPDSTA